MAMAPAPSPGQAMSKDPKTQLNHFCQRYCQRPVTKSDISYTTNKFGNQYQAIVKLDCIQGQEYAGHLCINQKDAEKSAAEQAVMAFSSQMAVLKPPVQRDKKRKPRTPEEIAERKAKQEAEGNPAITPKTLLNALVMKIAKRYLQKGETVYETKTYNGGGHQATVKLSALPGEWSERMWAGHVCTTKQKAEQSAAEIALESIKQDKELMEEADKPKGFGKGGKGKGKGKGFMFDAWQWGWMWGMPSSELPRKDVLTESITGEVIEWKVGQVNQVRAAAECCRVSHWNEQQRRDFEEQKRRVRPLDAPEKEKAREEWAQLLNMHKRPKEPEPGQDRGRASTDPPPHLRTTPQRPEGAPAHPLPKPPPQRPQGPQGAMTQRGPPQTKQPPHARAKQPPPTAPSSSEETHWSSSNASTPKITKQEESKKRATEHADTPAAAQAGQNEGPNAEKEKQEEEDPDDIIDNFLDHIDLMQRDSRPPQQQQGATEDQEMDQLREDEQEESRRREMMEEEIRRWELEEEEEQRLAEIQYDEYLEERREETAEQARTQHATDLFPNGTTPTDEDPDSKPEQGCHPADVIAHQEGDPEGRPPRGDLYDFVHLTLTRWRRLLETASTSVTLDTDGVRELANTIHTWRGPHLVDSDSNTTEAATPHEHLLNLVGQILSRKNEHEDEVTVLTRDTLETLETILEAYYQKRKWGTVFRKQSNTGNAKRAVPPRGKASRASASTDLYHHEHLDYKTWTTRTRTIYPERAATEPPTRTPDLDKGLHIVAVANDIVGKQWVEPTNGPMGSHALTNENNGDEKLVNLGTTTTEPTESTEQQSAARRGPNYIEHEQHHDEPPDSTEEDIIEEEYDQHHDEPADNSTNEPEEDLESSRREARRQGGTQHKPETTTNSNDKEEGEEEKAAQESTEQSSATRRGPHYSEHVQYHDELADNTEADVEEEHDQRHDELADNQNDEDQKHNCSSETREQGSTQHEPETSTNLDDKEGDNADQEEPQRRGDRQLREKEEKVPRLPHNRKKETTMASRKMIDKGAQTLRDSHGWIKADVDIDHKAASRREGKIFVGKSDAPEDGLAGPFELHS
ncbi:unnamed protein product, partial [Symbiodinium natans]